MTARRAGSKADMDDTQLQLWQLASASLAELNKTPSIKEAITSTNDSLERFEREHNRPEQTSTELKSIKKKLKEALPEIKKSSETEMAHCDKALEHIRKLIELKERSDIGAEAAVADKRPKRGRETTTGITSSQPSIPGKAPAGRTGASTTMAGGRGLTVTLPGRQLPAHIMERTEKQLPLKPKRRVAFRVPSKGASSSDGNGSEEVGWILAIIHTERAGKYTVQDAENEEGEGPPPIFPASLADMLPLPIADAAPSDPSHLNAYPEYKKGTKVLALYPETTSFYKAEVVASPKEMQISGPRGPPPAAKHGASYRLKFEEDEDRVRVISAEEVIDYPGF